MGVPLNPKSPDHKEFQERTEHFQVKPHPLATVPRFRLISMNQLYDQVEAEDAAHATEAIRSKVTYAHT